MKIKPIILSITFYSLVVIGLYFFTYKNGYLSAFWVKKTLFWQLLILPFNISFSIFVLYLLIMKISEANKVVKYSLIVELIMFIIWNLIFLFLPEFYVGFTTTFQFSVLSFMMVASSLTHILLLWKELEKKHA